MADLFDLLDRERAHLGSLDDIPFLRRLPKYVDVLTKEKRLRALLGAMRTEAAEAHQRFVDAENELEQRVVSVRQALAERVPEVDDSGATEPEDFGSHAYSDYMFTLAYFDNVTATTHAIPYPKLPSDEPESGPLPTLINILRGKLREAEYGDRGDLVELRRDRLRNDLDDLTAELASLLDGHRHAREEFRHASVTLPGVALRRLEHFARTLNPAPLDFTGDGDAAFNRAVTGFWLPEFSIQKAVAGEHLDDYDQRRLKQAVADLREQAELLHTEIVGRVSQEELRKQRQLWRRAGLSLASAFGSALVQMTVTALVAAAVGFAGGYLVGTSDDEKPPTPTRSTSTRSS